MPPLRAPRNLDEKNEEQLLYDSFDVVRVAGSHRRKNKLLERMQSVLKECGSPVDLYAEDARKQILRRLAEIRTTSAGRMRAAIKYHASDN